jgi:hypothetical protein
MFILQCLLDLRHLAIHTFHRTLRLPLHPVREAVATDQDHPFIQLPAWILADEQARYFIRGSIPNVIGHVVFRFTMSILRVAITPHCLQFEAESHLVSLPNEYSLLPHLLQVVQIGDIEGCYPFLLPLVGSWQCSDTPHL